MDRQTIWEWVEEEEGEEDIYSEDKIKDMLDNDELSVDEAWFILGYTGS